MKRISTSFFAATLLFSPVIEPAKVLLTSAVVATVLVTGSSDAVAAPVDHRVARRTSRRTTRRVTRRHFYALPAGARAHVWAGHRYYAVGGIFYYPYFIRGRTVYVQVNTTKSGEPEPPPPATKIEVEIDLD